MLGKFTSALYNLHLKCLALVRPHRNVVSHFESAYAEHGNELWIAMEYMDGGSLVDVLKKNMGRITEEQIARISLDVLQGLRHLHQCGLAHNGLKESKILFNMRGEVKIGASTRLSFDSPSCTTQRHAFL
ncbi:hypothetical protein BOTBODRAFT_120332 [Botryobasidium botryosum FD-172 SS1]|uniref:Protein kinase domain-containing protein n=1 Tax=Botryobasidium botryosum (strain FD-172 SS1) TaxID=930990 RepID=A0A067M5Q5_BOTB1|nr:hypothetical protein BOTBODRAFT_120332 [Botryobasidium botryosum FD-172 SS1]